jgi:hypothetical protein
MANISKRLGVKPLHLTVLRNLLDYVTVLPITLEIAIAAPDLALPHGDQFDRIIATAAKIHRLTLRVCRLEVGAALCRDVWRYRGINPLLQSAINASGLAQSDQPVTGSETHKRKSYRVVEPDRMSSTKA